MSTRTAVLAAASPWVRECFAGRSRSGRVSHAGPRAVYVTVEDHVLAVVARGGVQVPCGAHIPATSLRALDGSGSIPHAGQPVTVGEGRLQLGTGEVRVGRLIDARVPSIDPSRSAAMLERLGSVAVDRDIRAELPEAALAALTGPHPATAVPPLLGLGSGLTPLGDDVLCGWLATMMAADHSCATALSATVREQARDRTTALSATLLMRAIAGEAIPEFSAVLRHLRRPTPPIESPGPVAALAAVGHTSGTGMLLGLTLALEHLASRSCP